MENNTSLQCTHTATHPILYLRQTEISPYLSSFCQAATGSFLPLHLLLTGNVYKLCVAERLLLRMNEFGREGCVRERRKDGVRGGVGRKEGGKYDALSGRRKERRLDHFPPGIPVGVNCGKERQRVDC